MTITRKDVRDHLDQFKPYMRSNSHSIEDTLNLIAESMMKFVQPEFLVRGDVTVQSTTEYAIFKSITSNREVDKKHVRKLVESIEKKNLLYIRPLLVNEMMEVIDGQHRLEACIELGIAVPYMICPGLQKEDIHFLNSVQKNWTLFDFINYFTIEKRKGFAEFSNLANSYPKVKMSILMKLVSSSRNTKVRDGIIDIGRIDEARKVCDNLDRLNDFWKKKRDFAFVYTSSFATALQKCMRTPGFSIDHLHTQIDKNQNLFQKHTSRNEYLKLLNLIYNKDQEKTINLSPIGSLI